MRQGIAELAALVNAARGLHADVAGDAAGGGELPEQPLDAVGVPGDLWVDLAVGALEVGVGDERRSAVTWSRDVEPVAAGAADEPVQHGVDHRQAGARAPVSEEARLDVLDVERLAQEGVVLEVDLTDCEVVGGSPPA